MIVPVELGARRYDVLVGDGVRHELAATLAAEVPGAGRAAIVTQAGIGVEVDPGMPAEVFTVPDGEGAKSLSVVEDLCRRFAVFGLSRSDVVVAVGGGVVTDLAGFAAASFHRGTAYVNVATTLLAQVDAAIGGKTGVNLPEGKNLVGAFWQPRAVLCDTEVLSTLPPREWASGRGEMAKYAFLAGGPGPTARRRLPARVAPGRAGRPLRGHQGRGGGGGRTRGGPAHAAQLRPHPGPRPGGVGLHHGRRPGPPARRGGGRRAGVRRPAGPAAGPHRRRAGGAPPPGGGRLRPVGPVAGRGPTPNSWCRSWPGTRRPITI